MKTVLIYIDTNAKVGDAEHVKVFANEQRRKNGFKRMTRKASPLNMT
jgi:hypothetical protein